MAKKQKEQEAEETAAPAAKTGSSLSKIIMIGVPIFLLQVVVVYFLTANFIVPMSLNKPVEEEAEEVAKKLPVGQHIVNVKDVIVNPAGTNGSRFLLVSVAFDVDTEEARKDLEKKDTVLRDMLLSSLSIKSLDQLIDPFERENLRKELRKKSSELLSEGSILNVYFSKYIVQ